MTVPMTPSLFLRFSFEPPYQQNENNIVNTSINYFSLLSPYTSCSLTNFLNYVYGSRNGTFQPILSLLTYFNALAHSIVENLFPLRSLS